MGRGIAVGRRGEEDGGGRGRRHIQLGPKLGCRVNDWGVELTIAAVRVREIM